VRFASDDKPPSLYVCEREDSIIVASEPVDAARDCWRALDQGSAIVAKAGEPARIVSFSAAALAAA
jgi:predicted glutamine amidotransferase